MLDATVYLDIDVRLSLGPDTDLVGVHGVHLPAAHKREMLKLRAVKMCVIQPSAELPLQHLLENILLHLSNPQYIRGYHVTNEKGEK
jgi:hypothetical protein